MSFVNDYWEPPQLQPSREPRGRMNSIGATFDMVGNQLCAGDTVSFCTDTETSQYSGTISGLIRTGVIVRIEQRAEGYNNVCVIHVEPTLPGEEFKRKSIESNVLVKYQPEQGREMRPASTRPGRGLTADNFISEPDEGLDLSLV